VSSATFFCVRIDTNVCVHTDTYLWVCCIKPCFFGNIFLSVLTHFFVSIQTHISVSACFIVYFYILVDTDYCVPPNPNTLLEGTSMKILSQVILEWILNIRCTSHDSGWCAYHALHCYLPFILITHTPFIHCCCCCCHRYLNLGLDLLYLQSTDLLLTSGNKSILYHLEG